MKRALLATTAIAVIGAFALTGAAVSADPGQGTAQSMSTHHVAGPGQGGSMGAGMMMGKAAGPGMMQGQGMGMGHGPGMMGPDGFDGAVADVIKQKLEITPEQQPEWQAYVDALDTAADSMVSMRKNMGGIHDPEVAVDDRLALMDGMHATGREAFKSVETARAELFQVLTEEQKRQAKTLLPDSMMGLAKGAGMMMGPCLGGSEGDGQGL